MRPRRVGLVDWTDRGQADRSQGRVPAVTGGRSKLPRSEFLPFSPPTIEEDEIAEVVDTLRSGWITTGPKTKRFAEAFAAEVDAPGGQCLMVSSCTAALHLSMLALGIGPGDEVIVPTLTFAATANVVEHVGGSVVLVDVEPDTLCIDPAAVEAALTDRTRAVVPVHYAGHPADMEALDALAAKHGFAIVEDAAHAVAACERGYRIGSRNDLAAFSFYATKNMTTAEGGALTGPPELLARVREYASHGMSADGWKRYDRTGSWQYDIVSAGFKYNMTDIQAALGLHQLAKLSRFQTRRTEIVRRYEEAFFAEPALELPVERNGVQSGWHLYVLRVRPERLSIGRDEFIRRLKARNIGTSVHYIPLHRMTYYARRYGLAPSDFPVASDAADRMISLPLHAGLKEEDVDDVIEAVLAVVDEARR